MFYIIIMCQSDVYLSGIACSLLEIAMTINTVKVDFDCSTIMD